MIVLYHIVLELKIGWMTDFSSMCSLPLPDAEQQALILVIDSFVKKAQVEKAVGKRK